MKKFMMIAAVAAAALAMLVSCEKKGEDAPLTLEGKQWICTFEDTDGEIPCVLDFGATKSGKMLVGVKRDGNWEEDGMICTANYTIEKTSETSGVITYVSDYLMDLMGDEEFATEKLCYSELTQNSVKFSAHEDYPAPFLALVYEKVAKVSTEKITIEVLPIQ